LLGDYQKINQKTIQTFEKSMAIGKKGGAPLMGPHLISASTKKKFRAQGFEAAWSPMYHTQSPTES
jgi:hypothetical protein